MRALIVCVLLASVPISLHAQSDRVMRDLQAFYSFDERAGSVVHDQSGNGNSLDLSIADPNKVQWLRGFLRLKNETVLRSAEPAEKLRTAITKSKALSIEVWVKPENAKQTGPARVVSLSKDSSNRNLTLGQAGDTWEVRLRTSSTTLNGIPAIATPSGMCTNELTHVVYTRDAGGAAKIFVNGREVASQTVAGDLSNWDGTYTLTLGNEATRDRAWLGDLHLAAIYSCALTTEEIQQNFAAGADDDQQLEDKLPPPTPHVVDFVKDVQPILREHCFECHATGNEEASLNLAIKARVMEGGQHGPVLVPGNSLASPLVHWVAAVDADRIMPPEESDRLTAEQIGIIRAWIDQDAPWPAEADVLDPRIERAREHWAFQRLKSTLVPEKNEDDVWSRTSIDVFILRRLVESELHVSSALPAPALARRIYFDVTGLPPTPEQVQEFTSKYSASAVAAVRDLVDQLLSSQAYGERWARYWLDLVRYAESDGQESDRDRPHAYHFRDFVIRALCDDMPFDQFVRWQIAGDEYEPENAEAVAATGFLTGGTCSNLEDTFLEEERLFNRYNQLDDVISTLGTSMLGLTVGCARCHDHKYDAFSSREYYRLLSAFHSGDRADAKLPDGKDGLFFRDFDSDVRTTWLFRRSDFYDRELEVRLGFPAMLTTGRDVDQYWADARAAMPTADSTLQRRALADWITDVEHGGGALLARVIVNRIWQHHFGHGLVRTESDFGVRGDAPTHPELLEYLANDFVSNGWKIKRLHQMILGSAVWQQGNGQASSELYGPDANAKDRSKIDPENKLLWKMSPQRLEVEALRDAMLAVSETLNLQAFGPGFKPYIPAEANLARNIKGGDYPKDAPDNAETRRRSIYMFHKRLVPYPLFQAFDRPDLLVGCSRRQNTTVAPQALAILNDRFVRSCAEDFAERLIKECGDDNRKLVHRSFELAFSRIPSDAEQQASEAFIQSQANSRKARDESTARLEAVTDYCQSMFGLNEFIYVD